MALRLAAAEDVAPTPSEPGTLVLSERQRFLEARILAAVAVEFRRVVDPPDSWPTTDYVARLHTNARSAAGSDPRRFITTLYVHLLWLRSLPVGHPLVFPGLRGGGGDR